jgi:hypothetical protein
VAFKNRETGLQDITGIVDYKGEIDMIYRAGGVTAVHCQVVRAGDHFVWRPGMEIPDHVINENTAGQLGLADEDARGPLTGVYAYARLRDGGVSEPIVMARSEVMKHKKAAKSKKFWDGDWEPDMWLKTAVHKLYDRVPHSAEYLRERLHAQNAPPIGQAPAVGAAAEHLALQASSLAVPRQAGAAQVISGTAEDDDPGRWPEGAQPAAPPAQQPDHEARQQALVWLYDMFTAHRLEGDENGPHRTALLASAAAPEGADPLRITKPADLDAAQAVQAQQVLEALTQRWAADGEDVRANLLVEAERVISQLRGKGDAEPPAAESRVTGGRAKRSQASPPAKGGGPGGE